MITICREDAYAHIIVTGEFSLKDYKEFEEYILYQSQFQGRTNILFDLSKMLHCTIDVAIEELRFLHHHPHSFGRVAVVSDDQIVNWAAWLNALLSDAEIGNFDCVEDAQAWLVVNEVDVSLNDPGKA